MARARGASEPARDGASEPQRLGADGSGRARAGGARPRLRIAVLGAFHFPVPQGSQVFAGEQAAALARAGAELTFFCYGGRDSAPEGAFFDGGGRDPATVEAPSRSGPHDPDAEEPPPGYGGRAAAANKTFDCAAGRGSGGERTEAGGAGAGFEIVRAPRALAPRRTRAGPSAAKPLADAALAARLRREHSRRHFDAVIAHNGEAACVALAARAGRRLPVIYAVHAVLGRELPSYAPRVAAGAVSRMGTTLDRILARRCDGVIALAKTSARALGPHARGPVAVIPPGLDPAPPPSREAVERACARHGLPLRGYAIYTGNLDGYQALEELASAAARLPDVPVVVATHARSPARRARALPSLAPARVVRVAGAEEMRALLSGAGVAVLPRCIPGGFPIKLLNYMEAGRAIVARASVAEGLEHGRSAWLLAPDAGGAAFAEAVGRLCAEPERAERLGRTARNVLEADHAWPALARRTLALVEEVVARRARR